MKEFDLQGLGNRIYSARIYQQMKQNEICDKLGITQPYLSKIENGRADISISLLYQISEIINVPIAWLTGENPIIIGYTDSERIEIEQFKKFLISKRNK